MLCLFDDFCVCVYVCLCVQRCGGVGPHGQYPPHAVHRRKDVHVGWRQRAGTHREPLCAFAHILCRVRLQLLSLCRTSFHCCQLFVLEPCVRTLCCGSEVALPQATGFASLVLIYRACVRPHSHRSCWRGRAGRWGRCASACPTPVTSLVSLWGRRTAACTGSPWRGRRPRPLTTSAHITVRTPTHTHTHTQCDDVLVVRL